MLNDLAVARADEAPVSLVEESPPGGWRCSDATTSTRAGKPVCDWDDVTAREALVDALAMRR
jgi:hypothetical protein